MTSRLCLHDEIADILCSRENVWMTAREIARLVNERGRYKKAERAKTPEVDPYQICRRAYNYQQMFEMDGTRIRLRNSNSP